MLGKCSQDHSHKHLRRCSLQCSIRVTCCARGLDGAIRHAMSLLGANKSPRDRQAPTYRALPSTRFCNFDKLCSS